MKVAFSCEGCNFAEMEGVEQVDCALGLLDKYESRGFAIDVYETNGGRFKGIEKKLGCKMYAGANEVLEGDELVEDLRRRNQLDVGLVLYMEHDDSHNISNVWEVVNKAVNYYNSSSYKPSHVYFVETSGKHIPLRNTLNKIEPPFTYTVCSSFVNPLRDITAKEGAISDCKGWYETSHIYIVGDGFDPDFLGKMNEIMWDGTEEYALAYDGFGGYLTKSLFFYQWNGNGADTFEFEDTLVSPETYTKYTDKVEFFARQNGQERFIYRSS